MERYSWFLLLRDNRISIHTRVKYVRCVSMHIALRRFNASFAREKAARERRVGYALQKSSRDWSTPYDARTIGQWDGSLDGNVVCPVAWRRSHVGNIRREPTPQPERREHLGSAAACLNTLTPPPWLTRRNSPNNLRLSSKSWSSVSKKSTIYLLSPFTYNDEIFSFFSPTWELIPGHRVPPAAESLAEVAQHLVMASVHGRRIAMWLFTRRAGLLHKCYTIEFIRANVRQDKKYGFHVIYFR